MTWFSLPAVQSDNKAAFAHAAGATAWLAGQPQANAPAMQAALATQIQALNSYQMPALERFKILEVLRNPLFAIEEECRRRFEKRPVPLWSSEQLALDSARRAWRTCAVAYLHCLRACLDGDSAVAGLKTVIAHRVLTCLRVEQLNGYLALYDVDADFWRILHAVFASAEQMGVTRDLVPDLLLGETRESSIGGQYAMTLLLHLARPFELSRSQFAAATRWFSRWREQVEVIDAPEGNPKLRTITLDLSLASPLSEPGGTPDKPRWLSLDGVLRKMRKRMELLNAGDSPESLKLGSGISSEACIALLIKLLENLRTPLLLAEPALADWLPIGVASGLENIHRQMGGKSLKLADALTSMNRRKQEQLAIFGHVAQAVEEKHEVKPESWLLMPASGGSASCNELRLCRPAGRGERLNNNCLLALQSPGAQSFALASVFNLSVRSDGSLHATVRLLPGLATPPVAEVIDAATGKLSRQPAFLLSAAGRSADSAESLPSILLPSGVPARVQSIRLLGEQPFDVNLRSCLERGSDYERWTYDSN